MSIDNSQADSIEQLIKTVMMQVDCSHKEAIELILHEWGYLLK